MKEMDKIRIGFIGAGNMAEAIVRGLINCKLIGPDRITASDPSDSRRKLFADSFGVAVTEDNLAVVRAADVIILAIKPQAMTDVLTPLRDGFSAGQLVISIAAGIKTGKLDTLCGGKPSIIRVMPNTPALIGKGVSALCLGPRAMMEHMQTAEALFASVGTTLSVEETAMDAVTAISGSGPAYVFYWMEAMLKAAADLGFDSETARKLVYETMAGSASLAAASTDTPDVLRARVTSKGGTTEAAVRTLDEQGAGEALISAIHAAAQRSRELSGGA